MSAISFNSKSTHKGKFIQVYFNKFYQQIMNFPVQNFLIFYHMVFLTDRLSFPLFGNNISRIQESQSVITHCRRKSLQFSSDGFRQCRYYRSRCNDRSSSYSNTQYFPNRTSQVRVKQSFSDSLKYW